LLKAFAKDFTGAAEDAPLFVSLPAGEMKNVLCTAGVVCGEGVGCGSGVDGAGGVGDAEGGGGAGRGAGPGAAGDGDGEPTPVAGADEAVSPLPPPHALRHTTEANRQLT
jgi:hypothetical protein